MSDQVVEVGAYASAQQTIADMRTRFAKDSQAHARKARALWTIQNALDDPRWRDDVDGDWLEAMIRRALGS